MLATNKMGNTFNSSSSSLPFNSEKGTGNGMFEDSARQALDTCEAEVQDEDDLNGLGLSGHFIYPEILQEILSLVPDLDLIHCGRLVCQKWRAIIDEGALWKRKAQRRGYPLPHRGASDGEWPKHTYRNIALFNPFGRNLISNPCGEQGTLNGWQCNVADWEDNVGWIVEDTPIGADSLAQVDEQQGVADRYTSCFATTYYPCQKWQIVDLVAQGCTQKMMATLRPNIYICEWFAARFDCGSQYQLQVQLLDVANAVVDQFEFNHEEPQWTGSRWTKVEHTFHSPPSSVCYVRFFHAGKDTQFWAGHYGSKMTGATVRLLLNG